MIEAFSSIFTAFGLSVSAGLNAYLPLLIVALLARFTGLITLSAPYDLLTDGWIIVGITILLGIEILADKIPAVDTANDLLQTLVRPTAGAILFAASNSLLSDIHPVLALLCGLIVAGGVHAAKAAVRPAVTATSGGLLNPVVSTAEDVLALVLSILSILVPLLVGVILGSMFVVIVWWLVRRRRQREHAL